MSLDLRYRSASHPPAAKARLLGSVASAVAGGALWATGSLGSGACAATFGMALLAGNGSVPAFWLRALAARVGEFALLSGLLLHYRSEPWMLATALVAMLGSLLVSYSTVKSEALQVRLEPGFMRGSHRLAWLIASAFVSSLMSFFGAADGARLFLSSSLAAFAVVSLVVSVRRYLEIVAALRAQKGREPRGTLS